MTMRDAKHKVMVAEKFGDTKRGEYNVIARTGTKFGDETFGMMVDKNNNPIEVSHSRVLKESPGHCHGAGR